MHCIIVLFTLDARKTDNIHLMLLALGTLNKTDNNTTGATYTKTLCHGFPDKTLFLYSTGLHTALYRSSASITVMYVEQHKTIL